MREVGEQIKEIDAELGPLEAERDELAAVDTERHRPATCRRGKDEHDNRVVREDPKSALSFAPRSRTGRSARRSGILDIPRGAKLSGSRFYVLRGAGAALQRALITWMIDLKIDAGFTEIYPPFVTRKETLLGVGAPPALRREPLSRR